jgi:uncharacterized protein YpmB
MMKWIVYGFVSLLGGILLLVGNLYYIIRSDEIKSNKAAIAEITKSTDLDVVENVNFYFGSSPYRVVSGKTKSGESILVWMNEETKEITIKSEEEGWSKDQVLQRVKEERDPANIKSVRLGMEGNRPIWEITYLDKEQRLNFYYALFETGEFVKRYSLQRTKYKEEF